MTKIKDIILKISKEKGKVFKFALFSLICFIVIYFLMLSVKYPGIPKEVSYYNRTPEMLSRIQRYTTIHTFTLLFIGVIAVMLLFDCFSYMFSHRVGHPKRFFILVFMADIVGLFYLLSASIMVFEADRWLFKTGEIVIHPSYTYLRLIVAIILFFSSMVLQIMADNYGYKMCDKGRKNNDFSSSRLRDLKEKL